MFRRNLRSHQPPRIQPRHLWALIALAACSAGEDPTESTGTSSSSSVGGGATGGGGSGTSETSAGGGIHAGGGPPAPVCAVPNGELDAPVLCEEGEIEPLRDFQLVEKWSFHVPLGFAWGLPPAVANLTDDDGDGDVDLCDTPDILVHTENAGAEPKLFLLSGDDGHEHSFESPVGLSGIEPAIADLNSDGFPEVLIVSADARVLALDAEGSVIWESAETVFHPDGLHSEPGSEADLQWRYLVHSAIAVHDLDADGSPEILVGLTVLDAQGGLVFRDPTQASELGMDLEIFSGWIRPTAADLDGDGTLEVLFGYVTYNADGSERWRLDTTPGFAQPGDFDGDGAPEVLFTNRDGVWLLTAEGEVIWGPTRPPDEAEPPRVGCWVHPVALADMDGDELPEALINTCDQRFVAKVELDGLTILASDPVLITTVFGAPENGSTAYDFRGHGPDWLAHDHKDLTLYAGIGEEQLGKIPRTFIQGVAVPVVADVDNDASADVIMLELGDGTVRVYEDLQKRFSPARRIWNQWNYSASSVREDATIPAVAAMPWASDKTFRTQARRACVETVPARWSLAVR